MLQPWFYGQKFCQQVEGTSTITGLVVSLHWRLRATYKHGWLEKQTDKSNRKEPVARLRRKKLPVQRPRGWKSRRIHKVNTSFGCLQCRQAALPTQSWGRAVSKTLGSCGQYLPLKEHVFTASPGLQFSFSLYKFCWDSHFSSDLLKPSRLHKEIEATRGSDSCRKKKKKKKLVNRMACFVLSSVAEASTIQWSCWEVVQKAPQTRASVSPMKKAPFHFCLSVLSIMNTNTVPCRWTRKVASKLMYVYMTRLHFPAKVCFVFLFSPNELFPQVRKSVFRGKMLFPTSHICIKADFLLPEMIHSYKIQSTRVAFFLSPAAFYQKKFHHLVALQEVSSKLDSYV